MENMRKLIESVSDGDAFDTLRLMLDHCPQFFMEYYLAIPDYEDGLRFADYALDELKARRRGVPVRQFLRWDICLISLKLEMLDKSGRWEAYAQYFSDVYKAHPNYKGAYSKDARHLMLDRAHPYFLGEDDTCFYAHFLYLLLPRFEEISKILSSGREVRRKLPSQDPADARKAFSDAEARLRTLLGLEHHVIRKQRR